MEPKKVIKIVGAREHNLKDITVSIPKDSLTVITGPSGSGKSTLALDILYAEGQRRYIESLSSYARQFLGNPKKPDFDRIEGLCPAIAIDQKTVGSNPRSTVGTITEIYDYLRVLFARIGTLTCPHCDQEIMPATPERIAQSIQKQYNGQTVIITAPIAIEKKGEFIHELEQLFKDGFYRFLIDGNKVVCSSLQTIYDLKLKKTYKHSIDVIIDSITVEPSEESRLYEALEKAFSLTNGLCGIVAGDQKHVFSSARMCIPCGTSFPEVEPRLFSFNSPLGACKKCHGLGVLFEYQVKSYMASQWNADSEDASVEGAYGEVPCSACLGKRLNPYALAVKIGDKNIYQVAQMAIKDGLKFLNNLTLSTHDQTIAERLLQEIVSRYTFLANVGLNYLSLNRTARTLSGGEGQRIRLATQIGSALSGVVYILDEPSIGLHQRDNDRLINTLFKLRDLGNTVVVVEHDHDTMLHADYIIDMGPAAGVLGGTVIAEGTPQDFITNPRSSTGDFLSGKRSIERTQPLRTPTNFITLHNAVANNLKDLTVQFPLGVLCGISGVSGSGKSSLIMQELVPNLKKMLALGSRAPLENDKISGSSHISNMVVIDQNPIGRTSRSNPATYLGIFDDIRKLFASLPESNARGYAVGRFSFNVGEGRCKECAGEGKITVSLHFLPDVTMVCSACKGKRYNRQTLEITYKGKNIADVLAMTGREAAEFFAAHKQLVKRLQLLCDVGLDYIRLDQPSTTLSGGEAQRIKLVDELAKRNHNTLYILDEPTTGLHATDIERLLLVLNTLIDKGNSILVIEHNIDVLKVTDYLIDLGPEGGDGGGQIIAHGTPEHVSVVKESHTGQYIFKALQGIL